MTSFHDLGLPTQLVLALERMQILAPTPIQAQAIPVALKGQDVLASAQTGTGKTLAYLLPLLTKLVDPADGKGLILAPTRELAMQVRDVLPKLLGKNSPFNLALLIGGDSMGKQYQDLKRRPRLVVGTPGRVADHLRRGSLKLSDAHFLVLDEMDRMLDMGFSEQLEEIAEYLPVQRQTLMFSATLPREIEKLAETYLRDFARIAVGSTIAPSAQVKQDYVYLPAKEKYSRLGQELEARDGSIIVFVKTKRSAEQMAGKLDDEGHSAAAIHGDLRQQKRERVVRAFRQRKTRILVATDVAARGLDVPHIEHVINYDLPMCPEDYIHRIGRTGRAGGEGQALSLIAPEDTRLWRAIHKLMHPNEASPRGFSGPAQSKERRGERRGRDNFSHSSFRKSAASVRSDEHSTSRKHQGRLFLDRRTEGQDHDSSERNPSRLSHKTTSERKSDERFSSHSSKKRSFFNSRQSPRSFEENEARESRFSRPSSAISGHTLKKWEKRKNVGNEQRFDDHGEQPWLKGETIQKPKTTHKAKKEKIRDEDFVARLLAEDDFLRSLRPSGDSSKGEKAEWQGSHPIKRKKTFSEKRRAISHGHEGPIAKKQGFKRKAA